MVKDVVINGVYRHYKGHIYKVIAIAQHTEDLKKLVIYKSIYNEEDIVWARPLEMFTDTVLVDGKPVERFTFEGSYSDITELIV